MVSEGRSSTTQSPAWRRVSRGRQVFGRGGNLDRSQGCPQIDRKGDIEIYDFACAGRSLIIDVTCVSSYSADRRLRHAPDGEPLSRPGWQRRGRRLRTRRWTTAVMTSCPWHSTYMVESRRRRTSSSRGSQRMRFATLLSHGGPAFSAKYSVLLNKWQTRFSVALNREVANSILAGARNARGGEKICPAEGSEGGVHLFEPIRPVVGS